MCRLIVLIVLGLFVAHRVDAGPVILNVGGSYTQNFGALPVTGTAVWTNDSTLAGWFAERSGTGALIQADAGTNTAGNLYSYGSASAADRALGSLGATTVGAGSFAWGVLFSNTNALMTATITNVAFTGEQWRKSGGTDTQVVALSFSVATNAISALTPGTDAGWTLLSAGSFSSRVNTATAAALDGNAAANRTNLALKTVITVPPGSFVLLRWSDPDHAGNDHGLSVDDLRVDWLTRPTPIFTDPATAVSTTSAVLNGTANPAGTNLFVSFEYGVTTNYGSTVQAAPSPASGTNPVPFSALVSNLTPSVLYHFRAVGTNALPTAVGVDRTFFTPGSSGAAVNAIAVLPDNRVLVGGSFTNLGGTAVLNLARLLPDGSVDPAFRPQIAGEVHALAVQLDERVVVGGRFTHVDGTPRNSLARLDTNGVLDASFDPDVGGTVFCLALEVRRGIWGSLSNSAIYTPNILAGGKFSRVGTNTAVRSFARFAPDGTLETSNLFGVVASPFSTDISAAEGTIHALAIQQAGLIGVAGLFQQVGALSGVGGLVVDRHLTRADLGGTLITGQSAKPNQAVRALAWEADGRLLLGGDFTSVTFGVTSQARTRITREDDASFDPQPDGSVHTIALQADGRIIIGGAFTNLRPNGVGAPIPRNRIARLHPDGTVDTNFAVSVDGEVLSTALQGDGRLHLGGRFGTVNGQPAPLRVRLTNEAAATSLAAVTAGRVFWTRGGTTPETTGVLDYGGEPGTVGVVVPGAVFTWFGVVLQFGNLLETSTNGGASWSPVSTTTPLPSNFSPGIGSSIAGHCLFRTNGGWVADGVFFTNGTLLRARSYTSDGSGSQGLVETLGVIALAPRLLVETLEGAPLTNAAAFDLGRVLVGSATNRALRLRSVGNLPVTNIVLTKSGVHASAFTVPATSGPLAAATGVATVTVQFTASFGATHTAAVQIVSNDTNQPTFVLTGRGLTAEQDEDGDGLANGAEVLLAAAGFNMLVPDPALIAALRSNGLYRATDLQVLAGESSLLGRDSATGQFKLTFGVQRATNLTSAFQLLPATAPQLQVTPEGRIELRFTDPADASFFYVAPAP